jgi:hypothetical protein
MAKIDVCRSVTLFSVPWAFKRYTHIVNDVTWALRKNEYSIG